MKIPLILMIMMIIVIDSPSDAMQMAYYKLTIIYYYYYNSSCSCNHHSNHRLLPRLQGCPGRLDRIHRDFGPGYERWTIKLDEPEQVQEVQDG